MNIANADTPLEEVLLQRTILKTATRPSLRLLDQAVLKNGPRSFKVVKRWGIVDATGQHRRDKFEIEVLDRTKSGWCCRPSEISLESDEANQLLAFVAATRNAAIPEESGDYLVLPAVPSFATKSRPNLDRLGAVFASCPELAASAVAALAQSGEPADLASTFSSVSADGIRNVNAAVAISNLRRILAVWQANQLNANEEFWQRELATNGFLFSQLSSLPVVILKEKAYVGGSNVFNVGANLLDYLAKLPSTRNCALVEIKTPKTPLLGRAYRGVINASHELAGGVQQVRKYRDSLLKHYASVSLELDEDFSAISPQALLLAGNTAELNSREKIKSFEMFRNGQADVNIITFDELFRKVELSLEFLTSGPMS